jgi:hypothetical protein
MVEDPRGVILHDDVRNLDQLFEDLLTLGRVRSIVIARLLRPWQLRNAHLFQAYGLGFRPA